MKNLFLGHNITTTFPSTHSTEIQKCMKVHYYNNCNVSIFSLKGFHKDGYSARKAQYSTYYYLVSPVVAHASLALVGRYVAALR